MDGPGTICVALTRCPFTCKPATFPQPSASETGAQVVLVVIPSMDAETSRTNSAEFTAGGTEAALILAQYRLARNGVNDALNNERVTVYKIIE
jgi:hypothetical protein